MKTDTDTYTQKQAFAQSILSHQQISIHVFIHSMHTFNKNPQSFVRPQSSGLLVLYNNQDTKVFDLNGITC